MPGILSLVAELRLLSVCAGVLNTDNMSILGLTIDYGPYGFLDTCALALTGNIVNSSLSCMTERINGP